MCVCVCLSVCECVTCAIVAADLGEERGCQGNETGLVGRGSP